MAAREVKIGDRTVRIQAFKVFKGLKAGEIVADITKKVPEILDDVTAYTRKYERENVVEIDRGTALFQYPDQVQDIPPEAWQASDQKLRLPQSPSAQEQIMAVFPKVFENARDKAMDLLALLITPDSELREAKRNDAVQEKLDEYKDVLEHEADLDELVDLAAGAADVLREQFEGKGAQFKKLRSLWSGQEEQATEETKSPSKTSSTESSTSSPADAIGDTKKSSSKSPGETPLVSQPS